MRLRTLSLIVATCTVFTLCSCAFSPASSGHVPVGSSAIAGASGEASAGAAASSGAAGEQRMPAGDQHAQFQSVIDTALATSKVPGAAVIIDDGSTPWVSLTGLGDVKNATALATNNRFSYRSITKSFVVTRVLQLVADGTVGLDDPVSRWIPSPVIPRGDLITLRHLAAMRSGLPDYFASDAYKRAVKADPGRTFTDPELLGFALAEQAHFTPGSRYEYCNTNTVLLGEVVKAATGKDWAASIGESILGPLGLTSVSYPGLTRIPAPAASGYLIRDGRPTDAPVKTATRYGAAGGLAGTLTDLDRWGQALGSGELLTPELQAARTDAASDVAEDPRSPDYDRYGLGIGEIDGWWGHTGYGLGYSSLVMNDPVGKRTIAILLNGSPKDHNLPAAMFRSLVAVLDAPTPLG